MPTHKTSQIAKRVLLRYASSGTQVSSILQHSASQAHIALDSLDDLVIRSLALINDSEHQEAIYAEAGDMIVDIQHVLQDLREGVEITSYVASKLTDKKLKTTIPIRVKGLVDDAVKGDI